MKKLNISKSILSISSPGTHLTEGDNQAACSLSRSCNDYMADLVSRYPSQLGFWASLPLPGVEGALEEIAHTSGTANGVTLKTNYHGVYLGDSKLEPIFEELNKRHTNVFIHPTTPCARHHTCKDGGGSSLETVAATPLTQFPNPMFEFMFDTARALINLFTSGTIARYPNITFITPHAGGALLPIIERFASIGRMIGGLNQDLSSQMIKDTFARQFYFDLAGFPFPDQVRELLLYVKTDRLLYGSDYPFTPEQFVLELGGIMEKAMGGMWKEDERAMILVGNAKKLLS
jgi:6-methylsalicylate decarboxylase